MNRPSFPTRRSSDLAGHKLQGKDAKENERAVQYNLTKCIRLFAISVSNFAVAAQMKALLYTDSYKRCSMHTLVPLKDRKSTRLNSSHVSISYAVFCL